MREAFDITGKIVAGTATRADRERLEHLSCDEATRLKGMDDILRQQAARPIGIKPGKRITPAGRSALAKESGETRE